MSHSRENRKRRKGDSPKKVRRKRNEEKKRRPPEEQGGKKSFGVIVLSTEGLMILTPALCFIFSAKYEIEHSLNWSFLMVQ